MEPPARLSLRYVVFAGVAASISGRLLPARGAVIDVVTYGAVPDDGVNDTIAINNAIAAAGTGDTVLLSAGTYDVTSKIVTKSNLTLKGAGSTTILRRTGSSSTALLGIE